MASSAVAGEDVELGSKPRRPGRALEQTLELSQRPEGGKTFRTI